MQIRSDSRVAGGGHPPRFTAAQDAAVAKLAYVARHPTAVALLCGPAGVGKTMLLRHLAHVGLPGTRGIRLCHPDDPVVADGDRAAPDGAVDLLLLDDADRLTGAELAARVESWRRRWPGVSIVLAGQGRLLSVCGGDRRLEQLVRLRITLPTFTLGETRDLLGPLLGTVGPDPASDDAAGVLETIHEIAGGVPAEALWLADLARVLAAADAEHRLSPDDIEAIHRRLRLHAA